MSQADQQTQANEALVRRWFDEFANRQQLDILDELYTPGWVGHFPVSGDLHGAAAHKQLGHAFVVGFPDARYTVEHLIAAGDLVMAHYTMRATHQGTFLNIPPTGRSITVSGINLYRLTEGKIAEQWAQFDALGLLRQLGAWPAAS